MKDQISGDTVGINSRECCRLTFRQGYHTQNQHQKQRHHAHSADKTLLLSDCAENKIGVLFRHIFQFCLRAFQKTFAEETARADCDFRLVDIVSRPPEILLDAERDLYSHLLMRLEHIQENIVDREQEYD